MTPITTKDLKLYEHKEDEKSSDDSSLMLLTDHLDELRNKILISLFVLIVASVIGFALSKNIISLLTKIAPEGTTFIQIKPGEFFFTSFRVALYAGFVLALPVILWQLAGFIIPGLTDKEKKVSIPIISASPILFALGSFFAYRFVAPSMIRFLFGFGQGVIATSISIEHFVSFTLMIMAVCGFAFLLPIVLIALANIGVVDSEILMDKWREAILISIILGAILTPTPDPLNMGLVGGILIALYFLSCGVLKVLRK